MSPHRLATAARAVRRTARRMSDDEVMLRASALAFSTLLSLVPLLSVMSIFLARTLREDQGRILDLVADLLPYREEVVVEALKSFTDQAGSVSGISVIGFLVVTVLTFFGAQESLFKIFRVDRPPSLVRRLVTFSLLFLWGPLVVGTAQTGLVLFAQWSPQFAVALRESALLRLVPALLTFPALALFYWRAALGRVRLRHAAIGALASTAALEALKALFAFYVRELTEVQRAVYGTFAIALFFVASVQFAWVILLLGAEITAMSATPESADRADGATRRAGADDAWRTLVLLAAIGDRDEPAERKTPFALAERAGIDAPEVDRLLAPLVERGLLLAARSTEDAYRLAVPPAELPLTRVFDLHPLAPQPAEAEAELVPLALRLVGAARAEIAGLTLADLMDPKRRTAPEPLSDDTLSTLVRARPAPGAEPPPPDPFEEPDARRDAAEDAVAARPAAAERPERSGDRGDGAA